MLRENYAAPVLAFQRRFNERGIALLHAQLEEPIIVAAWEEGRAMTLEQALAYALENLS